MISQCVDHYNIQLHVGGWWMFTECYYYYYFIVASYCHMLCFRLLPRSPSSSPPSTPKQQRSSLADDVTIVGGNRTGIFVSHVRHGSPAEQCGLTEGSELLEVRVSHCQE